MTNEFVTLAELAEQCDENRSNTLRALRRWEGEVGARVQMARAGGKQKRVLLSREDAAAFRAWRDDMPATNGGAEPVSLTDIASRLSNVAQELADIAATLAEHRS
jgi:hypothetical protein